MNGYNNFVRSAMTPRPQTMAGRLGSVATAGMPIGDLPETDPRLPLQPNRFGSAPYTGPRSPEEANARLNQRDLTRAQQMSAMAAQQQAMRQAQALGMQTQLRQEMPQYRPGGILPSGNTMAFQTNNGGIGLIGREQVRAIPGGIENSTFADRRALVNRLADQNAAAQNEMTATARANETQRKNQSIVSRAAARGLDPRMTPRVAAAMEALGMRVPGTNRPQAAAGGRAGATSSPRSLDAMQARLQQAAASPAVQQYGIRLADQDSAGNVTPRPTDAVLTDVMSALNDPVKMEALMTPGNPEAQEIQELVKARIALDGGKLPARFQNLQVFLDGGPQAWKQLGEQRLQSEQQFRSRDIDTMPFRPSMKL